MRGIRRCVLVGESVLGGELGGMAYEVSKAHNIPSLSLSLNLLVDQDVSSHYSPAPDLPACCSAPHHGGHGPSETVSAL